MDAPGSTHSVAVGWQKTADWKWVEAAVEVAGAVDC